MNLAFALFVRFTLNNFGIIRDWLYYFVFKVHAAKTGKKRAKNTRFFQAALLIYHCIYPLSTEFFNDF